MEIVVGDVETVEVAYAKDLEAFGRVLIRGCEPGCRVAQRGEKRAFPTAYVQHLM